MKGMYKVMGIIIMVMVIGLLILGCENPAGGNKMPSPSVDIQMIAISAGTFMMGQDGIATPVHSVTLGGFYMGKYEVTQEQYEAVMGNNPSDYDDDPATGEIQGKRPVEQVSWYDAIVFCNKLSMMEKLEPAYSIGGNTNPSVWGAVPTIPDDTWDAVVCNWNANGYRLPTEAEWEYACRAGTTTTYNTGDTISDNTGWYKTNSNRRTHEVGKKSANAYGLYDMHGNVWEWCWDWYGSYGNAARTDPMGASSGSLRVRRGGGWCGYAGVLRSADRYGYIPYFRVYYLGFRVLRPQV